MITFNAPSKYKQGIIFDLLSESYKDFLSQVSKGKSDEMILNWKNTDKQTFENLETIGKCTFITCDDEKVVGFASYDPRQKPIGIIGHNVILPEFRGKGLGKLQIQEILRIFREKGFKVVRVSTGSHLFFEPAQKQYKSCGFIETRIFLENGFEQIEYELNL